MNKMVLRQDKQFQSQNSSLSDVFIAQTQLLLSSKSDEYFNQEVNNLNTSLSALKKKSIENIRSKKEVIRRDNLFLFG